MAEMLGCFLNVIGLNIGWLMFVAEGTVSLNSSIFWFLTAPEKYFFGNDYIPPANNFFSDRTLSCQMTTVSQFSRIVCYVEYLFLFRLKKITPLNFSQKRHNNLVVVIGNVIDARSVF